MFSEIENELIFNVKNSMAEILKHYWTDLSDRERDVVHQHFVFDGNKFTINESRYEYKKYEDVEEFLLMIFELFNKCSLMRKSKIAMAIKYAVLDPFLEKRIKIIVQLRTALEVIEQERIEALVKLSQEEVMNASICAEHASIKQELEREIDESERRKRELESEVASLKHATKKLSEELHQSKEILEESKLDHHERSNFATIGKNTIASMILCLQQIHHSFEASRAFIETTQMGLNTQKLNLCMMHTEISHMVEQKASLQFSRESDWQRFSEIQFKKSINHIRRDIELYLSRIDSQFFSHITLFGSRINLRAGGKKQEVLKQFARKLSEYHENLLPENLQDILNSIRTELINLDRENQQLISSGKYFKQTLESIKSELQSWSTLPSFFEPLPSAPSPSIYAIQSSISNIDESIHGVRTELSGIQEKLAVAVSTAQNALSLMDQHPTVKRTA